MKTQFVVAVPLDDAAECHGPITRPAIVVNARELFESPHHTGASDVETLRLVVTKRSRTRISSVWCRWLQAFGYPGGRPRAGPVALLSLLRSTPSDRGSRSGGGATHRERLPAVADRVIDREEIAGVYLR